MMPLVVDDIVSLYNNFLNYVSKVYEDREGWALCFRKELPLRGNNTNNFCEAQFLVIKDDILNRQKEVNVVGLIDKLTNELDAHYKNKLLSVASGKFDGIYSRRFRGIGYQIPSLEQQNKIVESLTSLGQNVFLVDSLTIPNKKYMVDMNIGLCECQVGMNGSPCKHQYILWVKNISTCTNFLPLFNVSQRQKFAEIATGQSMSLHFYEGLHDRVLETPQERHVPAPSEVDFESYQPPKQAVERQKQPPEMIKKDECLAALSSAFTTIEEMLNVNDQNSGEFNARNALWH